MRSKLRNKFMSCIYVGYQTEKFSLPIMTCPYWKYYIYQYLLMFVSFLRNPRIAVVAVAAFRMKNGSSPSSGRRRAAHPPQRRKEPMNCCLSLPSILPSSSHALAATAIFAPTSRPHHPRALPPPRHKYPPRSPFRRLARGGSP